MRSLCAALAVFALLALAGCGSSSSKSSSATATATATTTATSGKPTQLPQSRLDRLDRAVQSILSATTLFQSKLTRCVPQQARKSCVKRTARPAEAAVARSRKTIDTLAQRTGGTCSLSIQALSDRLSTLTEDLRAVTIAANDGDVGSFTKVGAGVQGDLRAFAAASQDSQKSCA